MKKIDTDALARSLENARSIQLRTLQLTNVCLSDESVISFARFFASQTLETLHISHRTETMTMFGNTLSVDQPNRIKDATLAEFFKSLSMSAS